MIKKELALILAGILAIGLAGCGGGSEAPAAASSAAEEAAAVSEAAEETEEAAEAEEPAEEPAAEEGAYSYVTSTDQVEINIASLMNDGINEVAAQHFKEKVEAATDGNITVNLLLAGVSGSETENLNQISTGELEIMLGGSNYSAQILTEWNATGIPFLFSSYEEVEEFREKYWDEMEAIGLQHNMRCLGLMRRGARDLTCNIEVHEPADVKGMVLRLPDNKTWQTVWESLDVVCTPVNMQEVYTALQTGVVDAQENPIGTTYENNLQEVCKYNILTHHVIQHFEWLVGENWWQSLPADYQQLIQEVVDEECAWAVDASAQADLDYRAKAEAEGMIFIDVDADVWRAAARDGILEAASGMTDEAQAYVKEFLGE